MWSNLFFRNPRLTALTLGLIIIAGWLAFSSLGRQEDPALTRRFASVVTFMPGADALRMETLISEPIEERLREVPEIKEVASTSRAGASVITIELHDYVMVPDQVWSKARNKLTEAEAVLPAAASKPDLQDRSSTAVTLVIGLVWDQEGPPQVDILSRYADDLADRLLNIPGTRETEKYGEADEEVLVTLDATAVSSLNLTVAEIAQAIRLADAKVSAGQVRNAANDLVIEVTGELQTITQIADLPIKQRPDGQIVRLRDIATVAKGVRDPPRSMALVRGDRGVMVSAEMEAGGRIDVWSARANRVLSDFEADLPRGVKQIIVFDQNVYTSARLLELGANMLLGAAIVMGVLLVTLGWKSALLVGAALPLTVLMVFIGYNLLGMPLHQTSMVGIIVSLGLLIDNAIVVVDDFNANRRNGASAADAISETIGHLFVPLLASTLTTCFAFAPIFLAPGGAGEFVGPLAIGVVIALTSSFFLAMTVIPAIAGYVSSDADADAHREKRWWRDGYVNQPLADLYRRSIRFILRVPAVGVAVSLVLPIIGFVMAGSLENQFFPANDRDMFQMQVFLPAQTSLTETRVEVEKIRERINRHKAVIDSYWVIGDPAPRVFYTMTNSSEGLASYAGAFVRTTSGQDTLKYMAEIQNDLRNAFPQATILATPFEQGPPADAPVEVRVVGPDVDQLREEGEKIRAIMHRTSSITYTIAKLSGGQPKLSVVANEDEAKNAGVQAVDIARQLDAMFEGVIGGSVVEATEELPVRVRLGDGGRSEVSDIRSEYILPTQRGPLVDGGMPGVPLTAIADIGLVPELTGITRRNGERTNTIQGFLVPFELPAEALAEFQMHLDEAGYEPPRGYRFEYGGDAENQSEALGSFAAFAGPLLVLMAASIILSFNSFRYAGIVFLVAFLAVGLALWGVWLFGHPLGFVAIVGTMGLVGLAINGAIIVLSALRADDDARAGDAQAAEEVVINASRHIISTTLTTVGGFLPLILFGGRFWQPMATAIAGGVGGSAILALYLTPALFIVMARRDAARAERERMAGRIAPAE
ncbi:efflux RND transporter permease subunit [Pyruvatibacter sp.]|uniref:efflux RND transporter permease subunit n=1 Tax=Pyruvatibacter sp. TaxID=1981328 RepID=UPI0032EEDE73